MRALCDAQVLFRAETQLLLNFYIGNRFNVPCAASRVSDITVSGRFKGRKLAIQGDVIDMAALPAVCRARAQVAELVDALVSGTSGASREGSSPFLGTIQQRFLRCFAKAIKLPRPRRGSLEADR